ncbi:MAG: hypothetical protein H8D22_12805 [Candidatus Cloacimonetes bacterium]|nr:hypothetical protein [Candidatus Cloacimonadota bacterium]
MQYTNKLQKNYWKYLEFLMFPIAIILTFFIISQYYQPSNILVFNQITKIFIFYFAILNIIKIAHYKGDFNYIKKVLIDLIAVVVSFIFLKHLIVFQAYIILRQVVHLLDKIISTQPAITMFSKFKNHPAKVILISFAFTILIGTTFLSLPIASATGESIGLLKAGFTATSATCVTGLTVLDTGTDFSHFGKIIILLLLQIGGLGIMTFSTILIMLFSKRISPVNQSLLQGVMGEATPENLFKLIKAVVFTTLSFEIFGALLLFLKFHTHQYFSHFTTLQIIGHSIFHSISAFCNAGFCLYPDSFTKFQGDWFVCIIMMSLIIIGGIGFAVLIDIKTKLFKKKSFKFLSLHSKIVIIFTLFLIVSGAILIFLFEYQNQFQNLPLKNGLLASIFQSVTTRTAGFNTMNITNISFATALWIIVLMFIGASPGSTGGGVKTTTFAILILSVWSIIKGRNDVEIFNRSISQRVTKKVMALLAISMSILIILILVLLLSEKEAAFEKIIFEAFSAFGTVGLSMGITADLTSIGKIVIILLMYLGRVGPLTIAFALGEKKIHIHYHYTEENIAIG